MRNKCIPRGTFLRISRPKADFAQYFHVRDFDVILSQCSPCCYATEMSHVVLAQNNQNGLVGISPYLLPMSRATWTSEMSGKYNLLSDVCVIIMDLFESLKFPPFGIGDLLYFILIKLKLL